MYNTKEITALRNYLIRSKQTISVAESVTSGHIQAALSLADQATNFFQGGITTYNLGQKARHLQVDPIYATACNSVSEKVAEQMATNVLALFSSDWALAITGYAAPVPELDIKKLFAFYSIAFRGKIVQTQKLTSEDKGIYEVQVYYAESAIRQLNKCFKRRSAR
jgi:PncC family amidohydrolase